MTGYNDFREFLATLKREHQLLRITEPVALEPDLAAAACALTQRGEASPAVQFETIAGYTDRRDRDALAPCDVEAREVALRCVDEVAHHVADFPTRTCGRDVPARRFSHEREHVVDL